MSSERVPVELCKGINGLEKVVLREVRGSSAEVIERKNSDVVFTKPIVVLLLKRFSVTNSVYPCILIRL